MSDPGSESAAAAAAAAAAASSSSEAGLSAFARDLFLREDEEAEGRAGLDLEDEPVVFLGGFVVVLGFELAAAEDFAGGDVWRRGTLKGRCLWF